MPEDLKLPSALFPPAFHDDPYEHRRQIVDYLRQLSSSVGDIIEFLNMPIVTKPGSGGFNPIMVAEQQVGGVAEDFHQSAGTATNNYPYLSAAETLFLRSDNAGDDLGQAGVTEVALLVLDANFNKSLVTVPVRGLVEQQVPGGPYIAVNQMLASGVTAGDIVVAAGDIRVYPQSGTYDASALAVIPAAGTASSHGFFTVPNGEEWVAREFAFYMLAVPAGNPTLEGVTLVRLLGSTAWALRAVVPDLTDADNAIEGSLTNFYGYDRLPVGSNIRVRLKGSAGGITARATLGFETFDVEKLY